MPQDTTWSDDSSVQRITTVAYDSLSPALKHTIDSIEQLYVPEAIPVGTKNNSQDNSGTALICTLILFAVTGVLVKFFSTNPLHLKLDEEPDYTVQGNEEAAPENICLTYNGAELDLPEETITAVLQKHFPYFTALGPGEQRRFIFRHKKFMRDKVFKIHDAQGFREMPVLISAAAIQLSFGLTGYMLPNYSFINIFPREFIRTEPAICFLEGNVSGNNIKISWKHFLEGYRLPDNGENVGLHEMAHAYYCQNFVCRSDEDDCFVNNFPAFTTAGTKAFETEETSASPFYSSYALKNFQEFWAETAERFFERSAEMRNDYPELYASVSKLLNQDPLAVR